MNNDLPLSDATLTARDRDVQERPVRIKLLGVGGAGANAVDRLSQEALPGVALAVINTDSQTLSVSPLQEKVLIGWTITRGLGAGSDPELGRLAAESDREKIERIITGTDVLILVAGMGGGTGSGAAPVIAELASQRGITVLAFVTMPFTFEGGRRKEQAEEALEALRKACDAVIPLNNDLLLQEVDEAAGALKAFAEADAWIARGVRAVSGLLTQTGLINLDVSSLRQVFIHRGGKTLFSFGTGRGEDPVSDVLNELKECPLRHMPDFARKADRLLVNITGGPELSLNQINELMLELAETCGRDPHTHIAMGAVIDENRAGEIDIVVIGVTDAAPRSGRRSGSASRRSGTAASASNQGSLFPFIGGKSATPPPVEEKTTAHTAAQAEAIAHGGVADASAPADTTELFAAPSDEELMDPTAQDELPLSDIETRGAFERTERNLWEGQDLDTPTYLRRGIRINLN